MSNWSERERKILKLKLGGSEKPYDPLRLILNYNRAVRDKGGATVLTSIWDGYHRKIKKDETLTDEEKQKIELRDAEAQLYLAELGVATYGEKLWPDTDGWTMGEAISALYQFLAYITKKEKEAENSPTSASQESPAQGETKEDSPSTPTTSAAS